MTAPRMGARKLCCTPFQGAVNPSVPGGLRYASTTGYFLPTLRVAKHPPRYGQSLTTLARYRELLPKLAGSLLPRGDNAQPTGLVLPSPDITRQPVID